MEASGTNDPKAFGLAAKPEGVPAYPKKAVGKFLVERVKGF